MGNCATSGMLCGPWFDSRDPADGGQWCCPEPSAIDPSACPSDEDAEEATPPFSHDELALAASDVLFGLSGFTFPGVCTRSFEWTGRDDCYREFGLFGAGAETWARSTWPQFVPGPGCVTGSRICGCDPPCVQRICLPPFTTLRWPILDVVDIDEDGTSLDLTAAGVVVEDGKRVCRNDATRWTCPTTITLRVGRPAPLIGQLAAAALACQLSKSCTPGGNSCIPDDVISYQADGATLRVPDLAAELAKGNLPIPEVQFFLSAYGVKPKDRMIGQVRSPDLDRRRPYVNVTKTY